MKLKLQLALAVTFLVSATIIAQVPAYVPSTGLVAWYGFSGNTNDGSAAGNNLTNNGATLTTDRYNAANAAYQFDGVSQYMQNATPSFSFGQATSFSVSWWMYKSAQGYGVAMMNGTTGSGNFVWNFQTNTTTDVQFGTNKQGGAWAWAQASYSTGQWTHFLGTYNNGSMVLYINGVQAATANYIQTGAAQAIMPFWVGRGVGATYHTGKLDDIGIWTRVLTPNEIAILYAGCTLSVTSQPTNASVIVGAATHFGIANNNPAATFQWQQNTGSGFQNITNGGQFSGATTDTLLISGTTMANNTNQFRCVIEESATCADTSNSATLTVCGSIGTQPASQSVAVGTPVVFVANSTDPNATYQWQIATIGAFGNLFNGAVFTGVTTDSLKLTTTALINNNQKFRCIVTSGTCVDTSTAATLTVTNIGIAENESLKVSLYPNPAKDFMVVETMLDNQTQAFEIINHAGIVVLKGNLTDAKTTINIAHLAAGIYTFRLAQNGFTTFSIVR